MALPELLKVRDDVSCMFLEKYGSWNPSQIYNTDETGIYYEIPPLNLGCQRIICQDPQIFCAYHSIVTVRADGNKLYSLGFPF
ncbi:hypothetical protein PHMEG_00013192 [Phytophthora megakarya]|uniref:Uncharacterized protein n=1 Tax=Phytophthora megakarya TaxID=4795 RepID=A0A225W6W6_9STRA|nr:hypothetical protein PHMEG_00013192 [Phytophthora megakarya]